MKLRSKKSLGDRESPPNDGSTNTSVNGGEEGQESAVRGFDPDGTSTVLAAGGGGDGDGDAAGDTSANNNNSFQFPFFDNDQSIDLSTRSVSFARETDKNNNNNNGTAKAGFRTPPPTSTSNRSISETRDPNKSPFESFHSRIGSSSVEEDASKATTDDETMMMTMMLSPITKSRDSGEHAIVLRQSTDPIGNEQLPRHHDDDDGDALNQHQPTTPPQATTTPTSDDVTDASQSFLPPVMEEGNSTSGDFYDLTSAKKQVGESSSRFIGEIKSAARRRRVEVSRSRDSLVAKEKEQLRSIAESNKARLDAEAAAAAAAAASESTVATSAVEKPRRSDITGRKHFDSQGFAGFGVPKVEKRPVTTPFSPLLGSRRKEKVAVKSLQRPRASIGIHSVKNGTKNTTKSTRRATISSTVQPVSNETTNISTGSSTMPFRARPLPSTTGTNGRAGQAGVPKVPKRPVTVPKSPCLGPKHQNRRGTTKKNVAPKNTVFQGLTVSVSETKRHDTYASAFGKPSATTPMSGSFSSSASSELLGLAMLDSPSAFESSAEEGTIRQGIENQTPLPSRDITPSNNFPDAKPYVPRSTCRANKRAEYDARRNDNIQKRLHEERKFLQRQIKIIHRELATLKTHL